MTRLVVVRHGNTFERGEEPRRIGAASDLPLTRDGERQGERLGRLFADLGLAFSQAWCGELTRARRTADLILAAQAAPPSLRVAWWLTEIDHGIDEGQTEAVVAARIGRAALDRWERQGVAPAGWTADAPARIEAWRSMFASPPPGNILLVTSNGAARMALMAMPTPPVTISPKLRTGAYGIIAIDNGDPRLECWDIRPEYSE